MDMNNIIHNLKIRNLIKIYKKNNRKIFFVEGFKEFEMAIKGGFSPIKIFLCKKIFQKYNFIEFFHHLIFYISQKDFKRIAYREKTGGIITLFKRNDSFFEKLKNIKKPKNSLILILDGIEKPGNLGGILRTANATGIHFVMLCNIRTYIFNPNVIRCSLGSVFNTKIIFDQKKSIISWLQENDIKIIVTGTDLHKEKSVLLYKTKFPTHLAIVLGSEDKGVSPIWFHIAHEIITIPMFGNVDSLNVSNAMSIIIYEIIRQRKYYYT
ncbi:RNA methyltransferase [Blattabacterium cuenoti]|uniref:RNA methyltransferase n=1 Tax=Blattabacterium cuenoti TaxID=1653831 RepID=UPI001EEA3229|nr:RNA methyltransferase [Blattabacterium cuenoti]